MREQRVKNVLECMKAVGITQMVVTDPSSLYYLTDHYEEPIERFWALLLRTDGAHKLIANRLFTLPEVNGVDILWYSDGESGVGTMMPYVDTENKLGIDGTMRAKFLLELMDKNAAAGYTDASDVMKRVRACKDADEIAGMIKASEINDAAMDKFRTLIQEGVTETDIADRMLDIYKGLGADGHSFEPLVGFGGNAANGHHGPDRTVLKPGDCVLFDVGCKKDGFCADMTRTFFYKEVSEENRKVYETVLAAQLAAEAVIRPGVALRDVDRTARKVIEDAGYGQFFTHRLGHFIGYDVHEAGDVSEASDIIAKPGMIFSIEPGIYLPGQVGVRIEDLVLVTEDGVQLLNHYSKELMIIE